MITRGLDYAEFRYGPNKTLPINPCDSRPTLPASPARYSAGCRCEPCKRARSESKRLARRGAMNHTTFPRTQWREDVSAPLRTIQHPYGTRA